LEEKKAIIKNISEGKKEKFIRIAERRVNNILNDLDSLAKCSDKKNYQYYEKDVKKIFQAIEKKVKNVKDLFSSSTKKKNKFSLR